MKGKALGRMLAELWADDDVQARVKRLGATVAPQIEDLVGALRKKVAKLELDLEAPKEPPK